MWDSIYYCVFIINVRKLQLLVGTSISIFIRSPLSMVTMDESEFACWEQVMDHQGIFASARINGRRYYERNVFINVCSRCITCPFLVFQQHGNTFITLCHSSQCLLFTWWPSFFQCFYLDPHLARLYIEVLSSVESCTAFMFDGESYLL